MLIMILFHDSGYRCLKHFYQEKVYKHMRRLFPKVVSYNRFVELEKEAAIPLALFIKKVLWANVQAPVLSTALLYVYVKTGESISIRPSKEQHKGVNAPWVGSSDSSCITYVTNVERS